MKILVVGESDFATATLAGHDITVAHTFSEAATILTSSGFSFGAVVTHFKIPNPQRRSRFDERCDGFTIAHGVARRGVRLIAIVFEPDRVMFLNSGSFEGTLKDWADALARISTPQ